MVGSIPYTMVDEVVGKLKEARALIARPWGWVRGDYARPTRAGMGYCALGAVGRVTSETARGHRLRDYMYLCLRKALDEAMDEQGSSIVTFNDGARKHQVLRLFDNAIEIAEGYK